MEFYIDLQNTDDATDLFLLAKERLLDVNDWGALPMAENSEILLTDAKGKKRNRNAHTGDRIKISGVQDIWIEIAGIQYDYFPDVDSESIAMLLGAGNGQVETIIIKRDRHMVMAHCNGGNELPTDTSASPGERLDTIRDKHPVLNLPQAQMMQLLQGMITTNVNAA